MGIYLALIVYAIVIPLVIWRTLRRIETKLDRSKRRERTRIAGE